MEFQQDCESKQSWQRSSEKSLKTFLKMVSWEKHVSLQENNNMLGISSVLYVYVTVVTKISRTDKVILLITTIQLVQGKKKKRMKINFLAGEKIRWKSSWVKINTERLFTSYHNGQKNLDWGKYLFFPIKMKLDGKKQDHQLEHLSPTLHSFPKLSFTPSLPALLSPSPAQNSTGGLGSGAVVNP